MAAKSDRNHWLEQEPPFDDIACGLQAGKCLPRAMLAETRETIALARRFNDEVVRPLALDLDRKVQENPDYLPWEFVRTANRWGLFTLWIPRIFGGKGRNLPSFSYFIEELASACTAMANLVGVHYLGVATLIATWNTRVACHVFREMVQGEKSGTPCMISLALTEPDAGTDVEDTALMDRGRVTCLAERVQGGYVVNGRKVFISNGHLSRWHMLCCFADRTRPSEHLVVLAVQSGTKGFSLGRIENKTDAGVKNAQMALALMGEAGLRHDRGAEKYLRDAKLMQIYEGTNQLNRLNLFKCLIARSTPGVRMFED